jgi:hypothetical protein
MAFDSMNGDNMKQRIKDNPTNNNANSTTDALIDLAVADDQAQETKGGTIRHTISNLVMADGHD